MKKGILWFVAVVAVIAVFIATTISGLNLGVVEIPSATDGIRLGLDLQGGAMITFEARTEDGSVPSKADMEIAKTVLRKRLDAANYTEGTVTAAGDTRLTVEIPSVTDPEEAVALLGKTAVLEFRDADGNVIISGNEVKSAESVYGQVSENGANQHHVVLSLTSEGREKFTQATKKAASQASAEKNYIDIYLDETLQSRPFVDASYASTGINSEEVVITIGSEDSLNPAGGEESKTLANIINSGRLPFALEEIELRSVGPTLGEKALETSLFAGFIGLLLVMLFMILIYRLPGVVASISLAFYTALLVVIMSLLKVNLSLPGIAGIILSIGMAVDANVIIYERIKEELRVGKTLKASIDAGFKRAFTAILDSNVTTLIAAVVLYCFGMGTIRGFAITLGLGVVISMFTVLVVSRFLLYRLVDMNIKSLKAYGA
ncbi:MAG: protein translocase subunit SecD [Oscillospiraceae bacterium]|nr:protein translocase subunit SecD [Oscillospiraceae bacterium]